MNTENNRDWDFHGKGETLLVDKPLDWTSFDVVKKVRSLFGVRKVGHAGTLDPQATGLLIVCTGEKTKGIDRFVGLEKEYVGTLELGIQTPSFDSETEVTERRPYDTVTREGVVTAARSFIGTRFQRPPMFSAAKYGGKALYQYARAGKVVERAEREIVVSEFVVTDCSLPFVSFRIVCCKGTYVRSLVHELGQILGCGAVLRSLRRLRIGQFQVKDAFTIEQLVDLKHGLRLKPQIVYGNHSPA